MNRNSLIRLFFLKISVFVFSFASLASATEPQKGGTLIYGRGADSHSLDPASETEGESLNVADMVYDGLVAFKVGTTIVEPTLAESWKASDDGKTYTFNLRKNVKFHDGTPFNADAVIYSFMRQHDKNHAAHKSGGPYVYYTSVGLDKLISKIEKVDDNTVKFTLTNVDATFLSLLAMLPFKIISPKALETYKADIGQHPVGTGPFKFVAWEKNQKIVLKANDEYWGGRPYLDQVIVRTIPDNSARLTEFLAGRIHLMDGPNPDDIKVIKDKMGTKVQVLQSPGFNIAYLAMNNLKKPFDNVKVRQAIAHAVNKKEIIERIYAGFGQAAVNPMPPTLWGYNSSIKDYDYNLDKAKALLKEAGYPNGFSVKLWAMPNPRPYLPNGKKVAEFIQASLAKIGVKAEIQSFEWATYISRMQNGDYEMGLMGWNGDTGDPDNFLYVLFDKDNAVAPAQNMSFYKNDKVHDLLIKARRTIDQKQRAKLYQEAQAQIHKDVPAVMIAHSIEVAPTKVEMHGFVQDPTARRRFEKVWLKK